MKEFSKEYDKLNAQQKQAVEAIEGPVLVVAGPGTGKTQLLSMRVANIMQKTDTSPSGILCLTFTNKAAINMRERLLSLIGTQANGVVIRTFHSFAAEIMNMYPEYFWNNARLLTAPDAVQLEIIQSLLTKLPPNHPLALTFAGQYTMINDVQEALKLVKEAGLTPEKLRSLTDVNLAYINVVEPLLVDILSGALSIKKLDELQTKVAELPKQPIDEHVFPLLSLSTVMSDGLRQAVELDKGLGKTTHTGNWKKRWIQTVSGQKGMHNECKRNNWWRALADVYDSYRKELHSRGYYDYADMLVEVINQLENRPDMLASVQERFLYVLIDEFQDTNAAQLRLSHLVADSPSSNGRPNLMAVGDDDQSIYKFNGAELNNMLNFKWAYPSTKVIVLENNYRSTQAVLDTARKVIEQASDRLVLRDPSILKNLKAVNPPKAKGEISHYVYPNREYQLSGIARQIKEVHANNFQIAVLARGHDSLRQISSILLQLNVPVRYEQQSNILEHEAVVQVAQISQLAVALKAGDKISVNTLLHKVLRHPMWGIEPKVLWELATTNYKKTDWLETVLSDKNTKSIGEWFLWLANESENQPLKVCIEYILGLRPGPNYTSPLKKHFLDRRHGEADYLHTLSAVQLLMTLVNEFSAPINPTLADFVHFLNVNRANGRIIADESAFVSKKDAVQLLTVHKAKGLEFDYIFIIDAVENNWRPRSGGRKPPANLPLQPPGDEDDDYARLMYVAMTRAKHTIIVSSYSWDHLGNKVLPSPLVLGSISNIKEVVGEDIGQPATAVLEENLAWPRLARADEKAMLASRLESYCLSATELIKFLDIASEMGGPRHFYESCLLQLPEARTARAAHGTAIHCALKLAQQLVNKDKFSLKSVLEEYERTLRADYLPNQETDKYLAFGKEVLVKLFDNLRLELPIGSLPEQRISEIHLGSAVLTGQIDRIDQVNDNHVTVVDYKTSKPLRNFETKDRAQAIKAWRMRTQLIFYALLIQNSSHFSEVHSVEGQIVFVEAESPRELVRKYTPSEEEIARLQRLINAVWKKIKNLDMPDTANYTKDIEGIKKFEQDLIDGQI